MSDFEQGKQSFYVVYLLNPCSLPVIQCTACNLQLEGAGSSLEVRVVPTVVRTGVAQREQEQELLDGWWIVTLISENLA